MKETLATFGVSFGLAFLLCLIALAVFAVVRSSRKEGNRGDALESLVTALILLGMIGLLIGANLLLWNQFQNALQIGQTPAAAGIVLGTLAALIPGIIGLSRSR